MSKLTRSAATYEFTNELKLGKNGLGCYTHTRCVSITIRNDTTSIQIAKVTTCRYKMSQQHC